MAHKKVSFSRQNQSLEEVAEHHNDVEYSLMSAFTSPQNDSRYFASTLTELRCRLDECLAEQERGTILGLLAALEGSLRVDYLVRCYAKKRDDLSRSFRELYKQKGPRVSLEDEILDRWKNNSNVPSLLISQLRAAFNYRHWLAHGRYWMPMLGRQYDYTHVYTLASAIYLAFPLESPP